MTPLHQNGELPTPLVRCVLRNGNVGVVPPPRLNRVHPCRSFPQQGTIIQRLFSEPRTSRKRFSVEKQLLECH